MNLELLGEKGSGCQLIDGCPVFVSDFWCALLGFSGMLNMKTMTRRL